MRAVDFCELSWFQDTLLNYLIFIAVFQFFLMLFPYFNSHCVRFLSVSLWKHSDVQKSQRTFWWTPHTLVASAWLYHVPTQCGEWFESWAEQVCGLLLSWIVPLTWFFRGPFCVAFVILTTYFIDIWHTRRKAHASQGHSSQCCRLAACNTVRSSVWTWTWAQVSDRFPGQTHGSGKQWGQRAWTWKPFSFSYWFPKS